MVLLLSNVHFFCFVLFTIDHADAVTHFRNTFWLFVSSGQKCLYRAHKCKRCRKIYMSLEHKVSNFSESEIAELHQTVFFVNTFVLSLEEIFNRVGLPLKIVATFFLIIVKLYFIFVNFWQNKVWLFMEAKVLLMHLVFLIFI